jgi:hypothetical protein
MLNYTLKFTIPVNDSLGVEFILASEGIDIFISNLSVIIAEINIQTNK